MGSSPFARTFFRDRGVVPRSLFLRPRVEFGKSLRASRPRTPLSLRDISRGRTETSAAVSVARTVFRDWGVLLGLFFLRPRVWFGETLRASRSRTPLSLRDISLGRTETSAQRKIPVDLHFIVRLRHKASGAALGLSCAVCFEQPAGVFAGCGAVCQAKILASLKIKNGISLTPLN